MSHRFLTALFTAIAVVLLVPPAAAQPADSSAVPRTAWGKPDSARRLGLRHAHTHGTTCGARRPRVFDRRGRGQHRRAICADHAVSLREPGSHRHIRRVLVRLRNERVRGQTHVAGRRSARRESPSLDRSGAATDGSQTSVLARPLCRLVGGPQHRRALYLGVQLRNSDDSERVQQCLSALPDAGPRRDSQRDGARCAYRRPG